MVYGCDPYNTVDAPALTYQIMRSYHGPLTSVAYRDQRYWDFAPGATQAAKLAALQARGSWDNTPADDTPADDTPAFLKRQAD